MPRNGAGIFTLVAGNPVVGNTTITSTVQNSTESDIAAQITNSVAADGQTTMSGNLKMGTTNRVTGMADGVADTDAVALGQANDIADAAAAAAVAGGSQLSAAIINGRINVTADGTNALIVSILTYNNTDPGALTPAYIPILRASTASSGGVQVASIFAANSVTVTPGSTLGAASGVPFRIWIVLFNDSTYRLGVINCRSGVNIYQLKGWGLASSTAEGGGGAADSAQVFYTGTAVTAKPFVILGYAAWESGLVTAGTWTAPTRVQNYMQGLALPGDTVQTIFNESGAVATGTTVIPNDDTIPQSAEGDQYFTQAVVPSSAANILRISAEAMLANSAAAGSLTLALFDGNADAISVASTTISTSGQYGISLKHNALTGQSTSKTFSLRAGDSSAGTTTLNGAAGARRFGGVANSFMNIEEVMA